jgi:cytoskeleton protein RodZ
MVRREVEERSHIAEALRAARERLELTIERAAADAGVPLRYARLLEGETPSGIGVSDELYLIPFFRRYATALGLPAEELLPDFLGQVHDLAAPTGATPHVRPRVRAGSTAFWRPLAVVLAVTAATVVILRHAPERPSVDDDHWSEPERAARAAGTDAPNSGVATESARDDAAPSAPASAGLDATNDGAASASGPAAAPATIIAPHPASGHSRESVPRELKIVAAEETWLSLAIDDEPKHEVLLQPGEARTWNAARSFTLTVGNAGGITVALDGRELPPLGRSGQVLRNLRLPDGDTSPG